MDFFILLLVQCSSAEANRVIARVQKDLPTKTIVELTLTPAIVYLYNLVEAQQDKASV